METKLSTKPHPVMWVAGIAVTLFSLVGIAAMMGWIPTSMGHRDDAAVAKVEAPQQATSPARPHANPPAAPKAHVAPAAPPAQVASAVPVAPIIKATCAECGVIESVRAVDKKGEGSGIGAVGGAVVGAVAGSQIGSGRGNTVATVAGTVGGAVAGHQIEKYVKSSKSYEIVVRLENGSSQTFHQEAAPTWRTGDRVKVVNGALQSSS
jgi:outer membrane lipoprotein SlyB